jgi:protein-S-isoprenylcysteine O-methyltransferase Ste14
VAVAWFIFVGYWIFSAIKAKKNITERRFFTGGRLPALIFIVVFLLSKIFNYFGIHLARPVISPVLDGVGIVLTVLGIAFAIWARVYLGRNWGMPMGIQEGAELVTTGPYTYVRNPIYTGVIFAVVGTTFVIGLLWLLVPYGLAGIYFVYSAKQEEKLMMQQFPNQYPEYKKRTKMFIPFIL